MTTQTIEEDHRLICHLAFSRLFPMLDEFAVANKLQVSADMGMLILLAKRLARLGHSRELILDAVRQAVGAPPAPAARETPPSPPSSNVLPFRRA